MSEVRKWVWPELGPQPINEGLDSEIFDSPKLPFNESLVREAIQNSLDAVRDKDNPVTMRFEFHNEEIGNRSNFITDILEKRKLTGLSLPLSWTSGKQARWLVIQDFNTTGLEGDINDRMSNFWNYWLNFGRPNPGKRRGGRGIGRVTFLIASEIHAVIGYTRRASDGQKHACGMSKMEAVRYKDKLRTTHAYLSEKTNQEIYDLYDDQPFLDGVPSAFKFESYDNPESDTGLALVIPFPHHELTEGGINASAIEHFAPAILSGQLELTVGHETLNPENIKFIANQNKLEFRDNAVEEDCFRYIKLITDCLEAKGQIIQLEGTDKAEFIKHREKLTPSLSKRLDSGELVHVEIQFPLKRMGKIEQVSIKAVAAKTPEGKKSLDKFFRDGMLLPAVNTKRTNEIDLILMVERGALSDYLNLCEGKAHLDLRKSKEVRAKLKSEGYGTSEVDLVNSLCTEIRSLLIPDITEPDRNVFMEFFSIPKPETKAVPKPEPKPDPGPDIPVVPPIPPLPPPLTIFNTLEDGFKITANPDYNDWPRNISITVAYADGSKKPKWEKFDFQIKNLPTSHEGIGSLGISKNEIILTGCGPDLELTVTGFDKNRELDVRIIPERALQDA